MNSKEMSLPIYYISILLVLKVPERGTDGQTIFLVFLSPFFLSGKSNSQSNKKMKKSGRERTEIID